MHAATLDALAKLAANTSFAEHVGRGIASAASGAKKVYHAAGRAGGEVAKGMGSGGAGQTAGSVAGKAAVVGTGAYGVHKGKRKVDEFRYRHGLYSQQGY